MTDEMDVDEANGFTTQVARFGTRDAVQAVPFKKKILENLITTLEEGMDSKAIDLLTQVSYAGLSTPPKPPATKKEISIPPPEVFSIITTLCLHPAFTTRQVGLLETDTAIKASRYLRTITRLAGATNCDLQTAWRFRRCEGLGRGSTPSLEDTAHRRTRNRNVAKTGAVARKGRAATADIDMTPFANLRWANEENVFKRCDDIWSLIGWALVCSCCYKKRWTVWQDFLELLIETLQRDFQERCDAAASPEEMDLQGTLINATGFLPNMTGGAGYKRIVRAIFANGSEKSRNEFTPVFPKETKKPPKKKKEFKGWQDRGGSDLYAAKPDSTEDVLKKIRETATADLTRFRTDFNDESDAYKQFQDQLAQNGECEGENESEDEPTIPKPRKDDKSRLETDAEALETWGGVDAIIIRLKLMSLVSTIGAVRELSEAKKQQQAELLPKKGKRKSTAEMMALFSNKRIAPEQLTPALREKKKLKFETPPPQKKEQEEDEESFLSGITPSTSPPTLLTDISSITIMTPSCILKHEAGEFTTDSTSRPLSPVSSPLSPATKQRMEEIFSQAVSYVEHPLASQDSFNTPVENKRVKLKMTPIKLHSFSSQHQEDEEVKEYSETGSPTSQFTPPPLPPSKKKSPPPPFKLSRSLPPTLLSHILRFPSKEEEETDPNPLQLTYIFIHDSPTLQCFFGEYTDTLRTLPVKQLLLFLSSSIYPSWDPAFRATLMTEILQKSMAFQPKGGWTTDQVDDAKLRDWYLPHPGRGSDVEAQVRMGVVIEGLARLWDVNAPGGEGIKWSKEMEGAVEEGIRVRREKVEAVMARKKKNTGADEEMLRLLERGEGRLRYLMAQVRRRAGGMEED